MNLLEISQRLALNIGATQPDQVIGSGLRTWQEALDFANITGENLQRRADWGFLIKSVTDSSATAAGTPRSLPADFDRFPSGICVEYAGNVLRPLTRAEWTGLPATTGTPRYFLLENDTIAFWPYLASGESVSLTYVSRNWTSQDGTELVADDDSPLFDGDLFTKGLIVEWRRQKGMDYADYEAEFEAVLADKAAFNDRSRF